MPHNNYEIEWNKQPMPKGGVKRRVRQLAARLGISGEMVVTLGNNADGKLILTVPDDYPEALAQALHGAVEAEFTASKTK